MRPFRQCDRAWRGAGWLATLALAGCGDSLTGPSGNNGTFLALESSVGDQIGEGFRQRVDSDDAVFEAQVYSIAGNRQYAKVTVRPIEPRSGWSWRIGFTSPVGQPLRTGVFENAAEWPGENGGAGFEFDGTGRNCGHSSTRFEVRELAVGPRQTIDRLRLSFDMRCEGATAPFRGELALEP